MVGTRGKCWILSIGQRDCSQARQSVCCILHRVVTQCHMFNTARALELHLNITAQVLECQAILRKMGTHNILLIAKHLIGAIHSIVRRQGISNTLCLAVVCYARNIRVDCTLSIGWYRELGYRTVDSGSGTLGNCSVCRNCSDSIALAPNNFATIVIDESGSSTFALGRLVTLQCCRNCHKFLLDNLYLTNHFVGCEVLRTTHCHNCSNEHRN